MHTYLMSIDPSHKTGFAVFKDGELIHSGVRNIGDVKDIERFLKNWNRYFGRDKVLFAIETQYYYRNASTFKKLVNMRFSWEILAFEFLTNCLEIYRVNPSKWQKWIGIKRSTPREKRKELSIYFARTHARTPIVDDNQADAINIGLFVLNHFTELPTVTKNEVERWL